MMCSVANRLLFALGIVVAGLCRGAEGPGSARAADYSLDEIRGGYMRSRDQLKSLRVEFLARWPISQDEPARLMTVRRTVAIRGAARYIGSWHSTEDCPEDLDLRSSETYYDGHFIWKYRPHERFCTYFDHGVDALAIQVKWDFVVECLGWWPSDDSASPPKWSSPFFLHEALADPSCRIAPKEEQIDGAWCCVVERPGVDRLWIDPAVGFLPRRREWMHGRPSEKAITYELSDYREASRGMWIPWRMIRTTFNPGAIPPDAGSVPAEKVEASLIKSDVNRVPMEQFQFKPKPGVLMCDAATDKVQQVPGGLEFLDEVVEMARRRAAILRVRWPIVVQRSSSPNWPWATLLVALVATVGVVAYWKRAIGSLSTQTQ